MTPRRAPMRTLRELGSLAGRVALVTGAGGRIGSAVCEALAERGASVGALDLDERACLDLVDRLRPTGVPVEPLVVDLGDPEATRAVPAQVVDRLGGLGILVNCAGLVGTSSGDGWTVPFEEQSLSMWRKALEVNVTAVFVLTQAAQGPLTASGHGSVVNIGSIYGVVGPDHRLYEGTTLGNPAGYGASKGALLQLTRWLATTLAPRVRVNAVSPGGVWRDQPARFRDRYVERTPLGRMAAEEDIKGAVAYLASDLSAYVTGHNLIVDGGWTAW